LFAVVDAAAYHQAANQVKSVRILLLNEPIMNHSVRGAQQPIAAEKRRLTRTTDPTTIRFA
jgi:hypothetical protein